MPGNTPPIVWDAVSDTPFGAQTQPDVEPTEAAVGLPPIEYAPSSTGTSDPSDFYNRRGLSRPAPEVEPVIDKIRAAYGDRFSEDPLVSGTDDIKLAFKFGLAQTTEKKREIIKDLYGEQADVIYKYFDEGGIELATKDGTTWHSTAGIYDLVKDLPETAASLGVGLYTGGSGIVARIGFPAFAAGLAEFVSEKYLKETWEPGRTDPYVAARNAAVLDMLGGTAGEIIVAPLIRRTVGVQSSPGAQEAQRGAARQGLKPITGGQATENVILQKQYKQSQFINEKSAKTALERFRSIRDNLKEMIDKYGLHSFSDTEIAALADTAAYNIDDSIRMLATGGKPMASVLPKLQEALDVFNEAARARKDTLYSDAFDIAVRDGVEFDFTRVVNTINELEKGIPVVGKTPDEPVRFLQPEGELKTLMDKVKSVGDTLVTHSPDGADIGALEQINAIRRSFSYIAWKEGSSSQGRIASQILDVIDQTFASPVTAATKDYADAYKAAQGAYGAWKGMLEVKKVAGLSSADLSTYQSYITGLVKVGNGPLLEMMEAMFKSTPEAMDAVRGAVIDRLAGDPENLIKQLDNWRRNDPRMLNVLLPSSADRNALRQFAEEKVKFNKSWLNQQRNADALVEGERALSLFDGNRATVARNIHDYIKWGGPNARENLQTAFINRLLEASETEVSTLLGDRVVDAGVFARLYDKNINIIEALFDKVGQQRLKDIYSYSIKIKETAVRVPALKESVAASSDAGTSLVTAQAAATVSDLPGEAVKGGAAGVTGKLVSVFLHPRIMAAIMNFDGPIAGDGAGGVSERWLRAVVNATRVLPDLMTEDSIPRRPRETEESLKYGP